MSPVPVSNSIHEADTGPDPEEGDGTPQPHVEEKRTAAASGHTFDLAEAIEACARGLQEGDDDKKLKWLASQVVGADAEFESPFGRRRITYCDYTASGRFLQVIEDYLQREVLPFYGELFVFSSTCQS